MLDSFKAVFFDAGGTLLHPYPSVGEIYQRTAVRYGCLIQAPEIEARFRRIWVERDGLSTMTQHASEKNERLWWRGLVLEVFEAAEGGIRDFEAFFTELYDLFARAECWRLYPGTLDVLKELKRQKKLLGVISNWDSRLLKICAELGLDQYFDFILASAVFGASKPDEKIFREALARSGAAPHEAVHIGDSVADDIHGARRAGLHAVLIERHPGRQHAMEGVPVIHDLKELLGVRS